MKTQQAQQWHDLSQRVEALALKLKLHLEQSRDDSEVTAAIARLRAAVDDAFDAAGTAVRDEAVREDVRAVGQLLGDAVTTTFAGVGDRVRDLFERPRTDA